MSTRVFKLLSLRVLGLRVISGSTILRLLGVSLRRGAGCVKLLRLFGGGEGQSMHFPDAAIGILLRWFQLCYC